MWAQSWNRDGSWKWRRQDKWEQITMETKLFFDSVKKGSCSGEISVNCGESHVTDKTYSSADSGESFGCTMSV